MRRLVPIMAALLALAACGNPAPSASATVRLAAIPGRPAAGYLTLPIRGDRGALASVSSPQASRIEMHETMASGTMSSMRPIARIPVRDGDVLRFTAGGRHLMIYDLHPSVHPGSGIDLVLNFERGPPQTLAARVEAAGGGVEH